MSYLFWYHLPAHNDVKGKSQDLYFCSFLHSFLLLFLFFSSVRPSFLPTSLFSFLLSFLSSFLFIFFPFLCYCKVNFHSEIEIDGRRVTLNKLTSSALHWCGLVVDTETLEVLTVSCSTLWYDRCNLPCTYCLPPPSLIHFCQLFFQIKPSLVRICERPLSASISVECIHSGVALRQSMKVRSLFSSHELSLCTILSNFHSNFLSFFLSFFQFFPSFFLFLSTFIIIFLFILSSLYFFTFLLFCLLLQLFQSTPLFMIQTC